MHMVKYLRLFPYFFHLFSFVFQSCSHDETEMLTKCWKPASTNITNMKCVRETSSTLPTNIGNVSLAVGPGPWTELFIVSLRALEVSLRVCNAGTCHVQSTIEDSPDGPKKLATASPLFTCSALKAWSNSVVANGFEANSLLEI